MFSQTRYMQKLSQLNPPNTFVGGVGSLIQSASDLASTLIIDEIDVENFNVDSNNNISFYLKTIQNEIRFSGGSNSLITYFIHTEDKFAVIGNTSAYRYCNLLKVFRVDQLAVNLTGSDAFRDLPLLSQIWFPNVIDIPTTIVFRRNKGAKYVYLPNVNTIGGGAFQGTDARKIERFYLGSVTLIGASNETAQGTFQNIKSGCKIYVPTAMLTINQGGLEADLLQAQNTFGAVIVGITDYTIPSSVSDLSANAITSNSVDLNFTPPPSTNLLDFYEVYVERQDLDEWEQDRVVGRFDIHSEITVSGQTITGLLSSTTYKIKIVACDIYWNRSDNSNVIQITTL